MSLPRKSNRDHADSSRLRRDRYRKILDDRLASSPDEAFFQAIWAVCALHDGEVGYARRVLKIPDHVIGSRLGQPHHIAPWNLETLVNERLMAPGWPSVTRRDGRVRLLAADQFDTLDQTARYLHALDSAETGLLLKRVDVMKELPRITHRQFEWQRGFSNGPQFYRWAFLYDGPICSAYFESKTGISVSDFIRFGVLLTGVHANGPMWMRNSQLAMVGLDSSRSEAALKLLSAPLVEAREAARRLRDPSKGVAYQPSVLRTTPLIAFGDRDERIRAPVPALIYPRVTAGLFYDLADAPSGARNEAAKRFEIYLHDLMNAALPGLVTGPGPDRTVAGKRIEGPDAQTLKGEKVVVVFECKARKMSFNARFSESADEDPGLDELAKGVFQLWRYFAHHRLGFASGPRPDPETVGVLLTLDPWMQMSSDRQKEVRERAQNLAAAKDPLITAEDRRPIVFVSIEELETTLAHNDEGMVIEKLRAGTEEKFTGWMLPDIHRRAETDLDKPYPLANRLDEVLPWFGPLLNGRRRRENS